MYGLYNKYESFGNINIFWLILNQNVSFQLNHLRKTNTFGWPFCTISSYREIEIERKALGFPWSKQNCSVWMPALKRLMSGNSRDSIGWTKWVQGRRATCSGSLSCSHGDSETAGLRGIPEPPAAVIFLWGYLWAAGQWALEDKYAVIIESGIGWSHQCSVEDELDEGLAQPDVKLMG